MSDHATSEAMIKLENVTKYYKTFPAVNDISFEIGKGEVFGFIGPNGAGKTTSIKMLATLMLPSEGRLTVARQTIWPV